MGREVRRVPADWKHPIDKHTGCPVELEEREVYEKLSALWDEAAAKWGEGLMWKRGQWVPKDTDKLRYPTYFDYAGPRPDPEEYMPFWPKGERTHYQMYETLMSGTPISPVMASPEALARWLADNNVSAFGDQSATYEQWLAMIKRGAAPTCVITQGECISGVEAMGLKR